MMQGKENLLTAYPVSFYAHTSGTLGAAKHMKVIGVPDEIYGEIVTAAIVLKEGVTFDEVYG